MTPVLTLLLLANLGLQIALLKQVMALKAIKPVKSDPPTQEEFARAVAQAKGILEEASGWLTVEKESRKPKPIHHDKVDGPKTANATKGIGYYIPKGKPDEPPFLAQWYKEGSTPENRPVGFGFKDMLPENFTRDMTIPPDSYVDEMGHMLAGMEFRDLYVSYEAIMTVRQGLRPAVQNHIVDNLRPQSPYVVDGKKLHPSRTAALISVRGGIQLTPEQEDALVEEYEVGKPPVSPEELIKALHEDKILSPASQEQIIELVNQGAEMRSNYRRPTKQG